MADPLHGSNLIAGRRSAAGERTIRGRDPQTGADLEPAFAAAHPDEIDRACVEADNAFLQERKRPAEDRARLLEGVANEIEELADVLVERVRLETGLGEGRIRGERGRTTSQLRLFAELIRGGSWLDARIDRGRPDRKPSPKPDIRRMLIPIGPVAVFGASNFPLAFSVAGGDTASALAAGCPVVVKAHPAHPGTSELVAEAIHRAVRSAGFHPGTFSLIHGAAPEISLQLVRHPSIRAVGFTGSLRAGRAIYDAAAARSHPIPVFAEMGSTNPVFVLPDALKQRSAEIAAGLAGSVTLGAGQFCTNPGVVVGVGGTTLDHFAHEAGERIAATPTCTMLHDGIGRAYADRLREIEETTGVAVVARASSDSESATPAAAAVLQASAAAFLSEDRLREEVFGPSTLIVACETPAEMDAIARRLDGNLTATIHGTRDDLAEYASLVDVLENKVGRLIFNGFPTGVEVCAAMHHGGPYPATTDVRSTSVGTAAILRFARPVCYQNFPDSALPPELRNRNERGIWRQIDGRLTQDDVS